MPVAMVRWMNLPYVSMPIGRNIANIKSNKYSKRNMASNVIMRVYQEHFAILCGIELM